jgi:hypothetical protein
MVKEKINEALKTQVWLHWVGEYFRSKCLVKWCQNEITARDFDVGHNIPESKGGKTHIGNLRPICRKCNLSMGNRFTIDQWNHTFSNKKNNYITNCLVWSSIIGISSFWFYYCEGFELFNSFSFGNSIHRSYFGFSYFYN